ncbi:MULTISPECIES: hypothetical protein [Rhodopseudomonas]|uniref:hypothetical protein n=1 Tax=Rhodopseudomonas TaxID=1073 RepID=UPI000A7401B7|nr:MULTISPECIES: hypothetical protein [Rhodopseudomonas]MDF3810537.1 hypothetical protein [Rhodopseudomonas sp. BAL398]WOK18403.1 hypothetical protein RBJ75_02405 [Rhodopseudomonas sp. BAL398]
MTKKPDLEFVQRCLMGLVNDAAAAETYVKRTRATVAAIAAEFGIPVPEAEEA